MAGDRKTYLGDGCYVRFDGFALWLTTEDGIRSTNVICLEPEVYKALTDFVASLKASYAGRSPESERDGT